MGPGTGLVLTDNQKLMWPVERLVLERVATLSEIETHYSIDDIADKNEALDARLEAEARAHAEANRSQK